MARQKSEFRPDRVKNSLLNRFFLTKKQRKNLLKWFLYWMLILFLSVFQDVAMSKASIFGATTELVPCGIMLICLTEGAEKSCVFCLTAAFLYMFSGYSPGFVAVPVLVILCMVVTMFRQGYLRKGFGTALLCMGVGMLLYELLVFVAAILFGNTTGGRVMHFVITALLCLAAVPILYPITHAIEKIGGESWKE